MKEFDIGKAFRNRYYRVNDEVSLGEDLERLALGDLKVDSVNTLTQEYKEIAEKVLELEQELESLYEKYGKTFKHTSLNESEVEDIATVRKSLKAIYRSLTNTFGNLKAAKKIAK